MRKILLIILSVFVLNSCTHRGVKPDNLLSKEKMRDVLIEIGLSKAIPQDKIDSVLRNMPYKDNQRLATILKSKNVSIKDFKESHQYYTENPDDYKEILKMIDDSLGKELKKLKKQDSLANLKKPKKDTVKVERSDKQKRDSTLNPLNKSLDSLRKIRKSKKILKPQA